MSNTDLLIKIIADVSGPRDDKINLLIVACSKDMRDMLELALSLYTEKLWVVESGHKAEEILCKESVDCLVSSYNLGPKQPDGFELVDSLRKRFPKIKETGVILDAPLQRDIRELENVDRVFAQATWFTDLRRFVIYG